MLSFKDWQKQAVSVGGTGALTLGAAVSHFQALGAGDDGKLFPYSIDDGTAWETGIGTYTNSGTSFARTTRFDSSTGAALNVNVGAFLFVDATSGMLAGYESAMQTEISGLQLTWVSTTAVDVGPGSAYVPGANQVINASATQHITGLALGSAVWGYVYLKSDGSVECNTTAPAAAYAGTARAKTADTTRRFIGAVRTASGSSNLIKFIHEPQTGLVMWRQRESGDMRVLSNGGTTLPSTTNVSCAAGVPPTTQFALIRFIYTAGGNLWLTGAGDTLAAASDSYLMALGAGNAFTFFPLDTSQQFTYGVDAAGNGAYADVLGYINVR